MIVEITSGDNVKSIQNVIDVAFEKASSVTCRCHCAFIEYERECAFEYAKALACTIDVIPLNVFDEKIEFLLNNNSIFVIETIERMCDEFLTDNLPRFAFMHFVKYENVLSYYWNSSTVHLLSWSEMSIWYNTEIIGLPEPVCLRLEENQVNFAVRRATVRMGLVEIMQMLQYILHIFYDARLRRKNAEVFHQNKSTRQICRKCLECGKDIACGIDKVVYRCQTFGEQLLTDDTCPYFAELLMYDLNENKEIK